MNGVWTVTKREYLTRVRTRWFVFSTLAVPTLFAGFIAIQVAMGQQSRTAARTVALVDRTGVLAERVTANLEAGSFTVADRFGEEEVEADLRRRVEEGELGGYLVLDEETLRSGRVVYRSDDTPGTLTGFSLHQAVVRAALEARLGESGTNGADALASGGELDVRLFDEAEDAAARREAGTMIGFVGAMILYFVILIYGIAVMRSVLEEKTSRVVEVVVSAIRPWQLMLGKLFGVGSVGLTQLAIWMGCLVLLGLFALPSVLAVRPELVELEAVWNALRGSAVILLFLAFFVAGYFLYSSLYAAVGAMCSTEEETQQAQFPVTMLVVVPVFLMPRVVDDPESTFAVITSLVPFFSPVLMFVRAAMGAAPWWQVVLAMGLMAATTLLVIRVAGRIYRVGILMQGKRPTFPELVRWMRQA